MSKIIKTIEQLGGQQISNSFPVTVPVKAGALASINPGNLVVRDPTNTGYWKVVGNGATAGDINCAGVAKSISTDTVGADGVVDLEVAGNMMCSIPALTPGSLAATGVGYKAVIGFSGGNTTYNQSTATNGFMTLVSYDDTTNGNCVVVFATNWV